MKQQIYQPQEDSYLLQKQVKKYAKGIVLDIGTGIGIQALTAARKNNVKKVIAIDVNRIAIKYCKKSIKNKKIKFLQSNLFQKLKNKFDTIIFNPPYLPQESENKYIALEGGKKGYEIIEKFLNQASKYLKDKGIILLVFSSFTSKQRVDDSIEKNLLYYKELSKQHIFFEDLYVYIIKKTKILLELKKLNVKKIKYFSHGKRGIILTGNYENKKVAIKIKRKQSQAINRIKNEAKFLNALNKNNIGPKLILFRKGFLIYEFIKGEFIKDWLPKAGRKKIIMVLRNILEQCHTLDKLNINKKEMTRPVKHIIINKKSKRFFKPQIVKHNLSNKKITMIDFERAHFTKNPQNVTQFLQYIMKNKSVLEKKGVKISRDKIISISKEYKKNKNITNILEMFK